MSQTRKLWWGLAALLASTFTVLLWMGGEIHRQQPPMPAQVVSADGRVIYTRADIETGRSVWQSIGGQQLGSIWGHGALVAPDWSADWLNGRIRTNLNARWRSGYDQIDDTGATQLVSGTRYAVWDVVRYKSQTTFNANVQALVAKTAYGEARLDLRVTNLFDTLPQTVTAASRSQPYRLGRSIWVGMSYKF